jgi:hypothetical protein
MNTNQADIPRQLRRLTILVSISLFVSGIVAVALVYPWIESEQPYHIPSMWVAAAQDLQAGHVLQADDLTIAAAPSGEGLPTNTAIGPEHKFLVVGHTLTRSVSEGDPITTDHLLGVVAEE